MKRTAKPFSLAAEIFELLSKPRAERPQGRARGRFRPPWNRGWLPAAWAAALLCLLWPAILNSQPVFFYDTIGYMRGAVQAFHLAGIESEWSAHFNNAAAPANRPEAPAAAAVHPNPETNDFVSAARSIYYGAVLYVSELLGSLWIALLLQALAVALAVWLILHAAIGMAAAEMPLVLAALGLSTPLSFYASYLMPDVFAGITILAITALLVFSDRLRWWTGLLWFALLGVSLMFHASFIAIAVLVLAAGAFIVRLKMKKIPWTGAGAVSAAIAIGLLSQSAFFHAVEAVYGHPPLRPPFLMARVIADGPGYDYLRETCPDNGFKICDFLSVLPLGADEILWSKDPQAGVVGPADPETRRQLSEQELAFVAQVVRHDFPGQVAASLKGFLEQLSRFGIDEFRYTADLREMLTENIPAAERTALRRTLLYRDQFPLTAVGILQYAVLGVSAIFLVWYLPRLGKDDRPGPTRSGHSESTVRRLTAFCLVVLSGVAANAAVTGILSTPHDRYQARVIWLIPLLAVSLILIRAREFRAVPAEATKEQA